MSVSVRRGLCVTPLGLGAVQGGGTPSGPVPLPHALPLGRAGRPAAGQQPGHQLPSVRCALHSGGARAAPSCGAVPGNPAIPGIAQPRVHAPASRGPNGTRTPCECRCDDTHNGEGVLHAGAHGPSRSRPTDPDVMPPTYQATTHVSSSMSTTSAAAVALTIFVAAAPG